MSEKPLQGFVICCTAIDQAERAIIIKQALEMGAMYKADLTADVTHLIVAQLQTAKHKFAARQRTDLQLMLPNWIGDVHKLWIEGQDVDLLSCTARWKLPALFRLSICVTNLDPINRRLVETLVNENGGRYTGDLTKENTHLIAGAPNGKKWEAANSWQCGIAMVGIEWLHESIKRGTALDESLFSLDKPSEARGIGAWCMSEEVLPESRFSAQQTTRKRKRCSKAIPSRMASKDNLVEGLWSDILRKESLVVHEAIQANEVSGDTALEMDLPSELLNFGNAEILTKSSPLPTDPRSLFKGLSFCIQGFNAREHSILEKVLSSRAGQVVQHADDGVYCVVPQDGKNATKSFGALAVTECWVERCLAYCILEDPKAHPASTPLQVEFPLPSMRELSICLSGFTGVDLLHIERLVRLSGASLAPVLTADVSILLTATRQCRKFQAAIAKGVRVVNVEWLWHCLQTGRMCPIKDYTLDGVTGNSCRIDGT